MPFAIIVENDESKWSDETGVRYHFPSRYAKHIPPGTPVIYYKGKMTKQKYLEVRATRHPHYFGVAVIGAHSKASKGGGLFAEIQDFKPFDHIVYNGDPVTHEYLEHIPPARKNNFWRDGVRPISEARFKAILDLAECSFDARDLNGRPKVLGQKSAKTKQQALADTFRQLAKQAQRTARYANGQLVLRRVKNKELMLSPEEAETYIGELYEQQGGLCKISKLPLQLFGQETDSEMLCSLDRIDSNGHYVRGNLQIVCRFINRWKSDDKAENFGRLLDVVRKGAIAA